MPANWSACFLTFFSYACMFLEQEGDKIPNVELFEDSPANKVNIAELCKGKKVVLFAVPGAFTPGCSKVSANMNKIQLG